MIVMESSVPTRTKALGANGWVASTSVAALVLFPLRNVRADQQAAAQSYGGLQKITALQIGCDRHFALRCA